ncbi:MAG: hypothetical protein ABR497_08010, partial [Kiritimatiellia bacterium]
MYKHVGLALLMMLFGWAGPAGADGFGLQVNDVSGLDEPWPLIGGLPFPEGALHDPAHIRIVDERGMEVPVQIDVTSHWPDGSIRWVLAGMLADPRGNYRVEFGPDVSRSAPENPLVITSKPDGLTVDTGAALYEFTNDELLPTRAVMDGVTVFEKSGSGAYLVDNRGRLARVAGAPAEIETEIVKQGPVRTVVRREGWYVTEDGDRLARAKVWFYFAAGSPHVKVTHTLLFTEDTNDLWVRDYGLEFRVPEAPAQVSFAYRDAEAIEKTSAVVGIRDWEQVSQEQKQAFRDMFSGAKNRDWKVFDIAPENGEVYMLQDIYPHFLERDCRAVIGSSGAGILQQPSDGFWVEPWEKIIDVVGDWGAASYRNHGLTVVLPWLAQQFPKEIAFGPRGARVALWSGRSARELDLRVLTLIREYWQTWITEGDRARSLGGLEGLAAMPSNARGSSRTHDVWLMPHTGRDDRPAISARAAAASNPPLLLADPQWLAATEAIGWPMQPRDEVRFAAEEKVISEFWESMLESYVQLRHTGVIDWGKNHGLGHAHKPLYRVASLADYNLGLYVWNLYARSGDRRYWEYGSRFNRFAGSWAFSQLTYGEKFAGGYANRPSNMTASPLYWDGISVLFSHVSRPKCMYLDYCLNGDEYLMDLLRMNGAAIRERWDGATLWPHGPPSLNNLTLHYEIGKDEQLGEKIRHVVHGLINLDNPNGFEDESENARFGALYKDDRNIMVLYAYYRASGDELARQAILKALDYKYRFFLIRGPFSGQTYAAFIFAVGYQWTGNRNYLRVIHQMVETAKNMETVPGNVQRNQFVTVGLPTALAFLKDQDEAI